MRAGNREPGIAKRSGASHPLAHAQPPILLPVTQPRNRPATSICDGWKFDRKPHSSFPRLPNSTGPCSFLITWPLSIGTISIRSASAQHRGGLPGARLPDDVFLRVRHLLMGKIRYPPVRLCVGGQTGDLSEPFLRHDLVPETTVQFSDKKRKTCSRRTTTAVLLYRGTVVLSSQKPVAPLLLLRFRNLLFIRRLPVEDTSLHNTLVPRHARAPGRTLVQSANGRHFDLMEV